MKHVENSLQNSPNLRKIINKKQKCQIIVKNVEKLWYNRQKYQETVKIHPEM